MALKHDAQGFLVGDPIDLSKAIKDWAAIRDDVRAIRRSMFGLEASLSKIAADSAGVTPAAPARGEAPKAERRAVTPATGNNGGNSERRAAAEVAAINLAVSLVGEAARVVARPVAAPSGRDHRGRFNGSPEMAATTTATIATRVADVLYEARQSIQRPAALPGGRDHRGRFVARSGADTDSRVSSRPSQGSGNRSDEHGPGRLRVVADRIAGAVRESGAGMQEADPAIKALNEVAQPMMRGYELLAGGDKQKRQERWLRRIFAALTGFRKDEAAAAKLTHRRLKSIEDKPVAEGDGGIWKLLLTALFAIVPAILAGIGLLASKIPGIGPLIAKALPKILPKSAAVLLPKAGQVAGASGKPGPLRRMFGRGGVAATAEGAGAVSSDRLAGGAGAVTRRGPLARVGSAAGKLGRRIPVIGSLLALGLGAVESASIEGDASITRQRKNAAQGQNWGGVGGGLGGAAAGAAIGTAIFPGVGTAIGGVVGAVLGEWLGGNLGETIGAKWSEFTDSLTTTFNEVKAVALGTWDWVKEGWDEAVLRIGDTFDQLKESLGERWDQFTDGLSSLYEGLKKIPIIGDGIRATEAAAQKARDVASAALDKTVESGRKAVSAVASSVRRGWEATKNAVSEALPEGWKQKVAAHRNWRDAKQRIVGAATAAGVDAGVLAKIANFESSFNSNAAPVREDGTRISSAHGYGQFIDSTWTEMLNKHGAKYGVAGAGTLSKARAARFRDDKDLQAAMLAEFTRENVEKGRRYGAADDDANVYAFHNLGEGGATKLLSAIRASPDQKVSDVLPWNVIKGNPSLYGSGNITVADVYARMGSVMRRGEMFAADARAVQSVRAFPPANVASVDTGDGSLPGTNPLPAQQIVPAQPSSAATEQSPQAGTSTMPASSATVQSAPVVAAAASAAVIAPAAGSPTAADPETAPAVANTPAVAVMPPLPDVLATPTAVVSADISNGVSRPVQNMFAGLAAPAAPVVVSASMPTAPVAPTVPSFADAPQISIPLASNESSRPIVLASPPQEVGQDLRERGIAHIVTGGLATMLTT